jgi:hypothetical protein
MADNENSGGKDWHGIAIRYKMQRDANKAKVDEATRELADIRSKIENAERERDDFRSKADSSIHLKELERLRGQIRLGRHRAEFDKIASEMGAKPKAMDDVFAASGWKADTEEVDAETMRLAVAEVKAKKDYLFGGSEENGQDEVDGAQGARGQKRAVGSGRGGTSEGGAPAIDYNRAKSDPKYASENYDKYVAASKRELESYGIS